MEIIADAQKTYALILGIILGILGIWGFFSTNVLGVFIMNTWLNLLHLVGAATGIYIGAKGQGRGYNKIIGWVGVILGILGLILLQLDTAVAVLYLVIGAVSLIVGYAIKK